MWELADFQAYPLQSVSPKYLLSGFRSRQRSCLSAMQTHSYIKTSTCKLIPE